MKTIEVSLDVYNGLGKLSRGFDDTPSMVIERLINYFNNSKSPSSNVNAPKKYQKDYTKYDFKNYSRLPKNRLVLEVVRQFVRDNKGISFQGLETKLPKSLQGSFGVFDKFEKGSKAFIKRSRFFTEEQELIQLSDMKIAVCTEWGIANINDFIKQAKELGYTISEI